MTSIAGRLIPGIPLLALLTALSAGQDALSLKDGRFVFGPDMTETPDKVIIHYENGDVEVPKEMVSEVSASERKGMGEKELSEADKRMLERGLVRYDGRWVRPEVRDRKLAEQREERLARIKEARMSRQWRNRHRLRTRHFSFEYTIEPSVMERYAELMETYYKVFTKQWRIRKPSGLGRLTVCFYHDQDTYYQVSGAPRGAVGYFKFSDPWELNFYYDRMDEEFTQDVMFHETNHYLTQLIDPRFRYPIWINESLAEYYGASEWLPEKGEMSVGHIQEGRLASIQDDIARGDMQDLEELIRTPQAAFHAGKYAWGWSLVHYLMENRRYAQRFKKFFLALAKDGRIDRVPAGGQFRTVEADECIKAFKGYLGLRSLDELEKAWHEYVKGLEAASPRGFYKAALQYLRWDMPLKATRYLETAIEKGYRTAACYAALARAYRRKSRHEDAVRAYEKAIACDPLNGLLYIRLARAKARGPATGSEDPEVMRLKKLALEIAPDDYRVLSEISLDESMAKVLEELGEERTKNGGEGDG